MDLTTWGFLEGFHTTQYDLNLGIAAGVTKNALSFPYYIVRFKHNINKNKHNGKRQFPYYIVRFKPIFPDMSWDRRCGFHTTQYDLNPHTDIVSNIAPYCFHTTQYDLNNKHSKQKHSQIKFPYYIVRFKQGKFFQRYILYDSFHTTQYDLNFINFLYYSSRHYLFPYYIVRFKHFSLRTQVE